MIRPASRLTVTTAATIFCLALPAFCAADNLLPVAPPKTTTNTNQPTEATEPSDDSNDLVVQAKETKTYTLEPVASFDEYMPRGVAATKDGRIFVCFPRHEPNHDYTVAEIKNNKVIPFPNAEINKAEINDPKNHLISVISATVDNKNRLWLLDCGRIARDQIKDAGKLVAVDLQTGQIVKNITFTDNILLPTSVFKDIRIDSAIGEDGTAIIIDSAPLGASAIIVVDLASGKSIRRLNNHPSVIAEPDFVIFADGEMLLLRESEDNKKDWTPGVSGLAISADEKNLYYSPLSCPDIYSLSLPKLCDAHVDETDVEKTVKSIGREVGTSDGMESDSQNRLYLTDVENNTIWRRNADGTLEKIVKDDRLSWPDRLYLAANGYLYVTASQFHRSPWFHYGEDMRELPYQLFRIKVDAQPIQLK